MHADLWGYRFERKGTWAGKRYAAIEAAVPVPTMIRLYCLVIITASRCAIGNQIRPAVCTGIGA
jgi:hypothetical protein